LITRENIKPANVTFSVTQGTVVPSTVALHPVPASVIQLAPQYRGYNYFATNDRIVIVEPTKKTVIAVIQKGSAARASAPATKTSVQFTDEQRAVIRKSASTSQQKVPSSVTAAVRGAKISVEQEVPATVQLEEFSEDVVRAVPSAKEYRYYRQDQDLVVVDPGQRRVIEVIR
jgi:hypothetical protein